MAGEAHGYRKVLRVLHLDLQAERWKEASCEELHPLDFIEATSTRQQRLEAVLIIFHGPHTAAGRQLEEGRRSERGPEAHVDEVLEARPRRRALVLLELCIPQLRDILKIVRRHPNSFLRHNPLLQEKRLALVDEG